MNKLYILGCNSDIYRKKKNLLKKAYSEFEIIEVRYFELNKIEKCTKVIVFAYSRTFNENKYISNYLIENKNHTLYFLSASSLSIFCLSFGYSRAKRKQLLYLTRQTSNNAYLAIFGSFEKIERFGSVAITDDVMLRKTCIDHKNGVCGIFNVFEKKKQGRGSIKKYVKLCYFIFGIPLGSYLLRGFTNNIYGYSDASFYLTSLSRGTILSTLLLMLTTLCSYLPFVWVIVIYWIYDLIRF
jgi:hypothetical protein